MANILVIGSSNTDMVVKTSQFPQAGETILGGDFFMFPGGKGANQAVAAARLGAHVTLVAKVGQDIFGQQAKAGFEKENIDTSFVFTDSEVASGVALITVNEAGENSIVVASGANNQLSIDNIDHAHIALEAADMMLIQLETPLSTVAYAIEKGAKMGKKVILNPAPAQLLSENIYKNLFLLTPNETETELLTGIKVKDLNSASTAANVFLQKGLANVIITMGAQGAFFKNKTDEYLIPAPKVKAVDTTAAGDVFNGALAVALSEGQSWRTGIGFACKAASIAVTRMGAQASAPYRTEL